MARPTEININRTALVHNLGVIRKLAHPAHVLAVVKSNGYGHGLITTVSSLEEADGFGVACLEEAVRIRESGSDKMILLLEGVFSVEELEIVARHRLAMVVHCQEQLSFLHNFHNKHLCSGLWIKVDTGMHRLGFCPNKIPEVLEIISSMDLAVPVVLMSHFADAHNTDSVMVATQSKIFTSLVERYPDLQLSLANSAALVTQKIYHYHWIRSGIMLYGISPLPGSTGTSHDLLPVMSFRSRLIAIKRIDAGETVGYGASWRAPESMYVGIVAAGYGDGYPRQSAAPLPVIVNGTATFVIGFPSMDMLAVDLRPIVNPKIGDSVLLWGYDESHEQFLPIEQVAEAAGTIPYVLSCAVRPRLNF